jgi:hypothetical protein
MKEKLINMIWIWTGEPTASVSNVYRDALAQQLALRWLYLLRKFQFCLPDFEVLQLQLSQDQSLPYMTVSLCQTPSAGNARRVKCLLNKIPEESESAKYASVVNNAIFSCLKLFWPADESENSTKLNQVRELIEEQGNSFPVMFRNAESRHLAAELQIQPCGVFGLGGVVYVSLTDSKSSKSKVRKLLEFRNFEFMIACCKHLKIAKDQLRITGNDFWHRINPDMVSEVIIDIPAFLSETEDESEWLKTDLATLRERLIQDPGMHPILKGIDLGALLLRDQDGSS